jgi:hypothetical protein
MTDEQPEQAPDEAKPLPMLVCHGEGYVTKADGTVIPFTIHGESK